MHTRLVLSRFLCKAPTADPHLVPPILDELSSRFTASGVALLPVGPAYTPKSGTQIDSPAVVPGPSVRGGSPNSMMPRF